MTCQSFAVFESPRFENGEKMLPDRRVDCELPAGHDGPHQSGRWGTSWTDYRQRSRDDNQTGDNA